MTYIDDDTSDHHYQTQERQRKQDRAERLASLGHGLLGNGEDASMMAMVEGDEAANERAVQAIQREEEGHEQGMVKFVQKLVGGTFSSGSFIYLCVYMPCLTFAL